MRNSSGRAVCIDPGSEICGVCTLGSDGSIANTEMLPIDALCNRLRSNARYDPQAVVVEWVESFGMRVGRDVFETVYNIGRIAECAGGNVHRVTRREVKLALVGNARAGDADVRLAICEMYGGKAAAIGTKGAPGPLYGVKGHCWSALAVALTWRMKQEGAA